MSYLGSNRKLSLAIVLLLVSVAALSCSQSAQPAPASSAKSTETIQPSSAAQPAATTAPKPSGTTQPVPASAKSSETTVVRVAHLGTAGDAYTYIGMEKGYFKQEGINIELTLFDTAAKMIAPMGADQLDVARGSASAGLFNAIARDVPIKIVADMARVGNNRYLSLVARKDLVDSGGLKDYSDLKGKNIAFNAKGTSNEIAIDKALQKGKLSFNDANLVEMALGDMNTALANKAVDLALDVEPFITTGQEKGILSTWKTAYDFFPDHEIAVMMFSPGFINDRPEVAKRFMVAYVKGVRDYYNAFYKNQNKKEIIDIIAKYASTKDPAMFDKMDPQGIDPNGYVNAKSIMDDQDWFVSKGYIKNKVDEKTLIDNEFVDYAVQQLGKYQ